MLREATACEEFGLGAGSNMVVEYSSEVMRHFRSPRNTGETTPRDGVMYASGPRFSMQMSVALVGNVVADVRFQATSCVVAVAACSLLTETVRGATVDEALAITPEQLATALGGVPRNLIDRCELAVTVLRGALRQARSGVAAES